MPDKPTTAEGYSREYLELVRATCLYIATKLGDLAEDIVVIGGLVPSLLVDQENLPAGAESHVGTLDLDMGLSLALLDEGRYRTLSERLRGAGFAMDQNEDGKDTRQRWRLDAAKTVTVDFLIPPGLPGDRGGRLRNIERDFAAVIAPGLHLAFRDRRRVRLSGATVFGEQATRDIWACGPGAYVVLKALAFHLRGENKDAYDLYYVIRNCGTGAKEVAADLKDLLDDASAREAIEILRRDFSREDSLGCVRVAEFLFGGPDDIIQADVVGFVAAFLRGLTE